MFSQAQDAGLIPPGKRYFPAGHVANQEALRALEHLFCVDLRGDSSVGQTLQKVQTPLAWAYFERLEMVKTKLGFLDQYALWEEVQSKRRKHQSPHHKFKLSDSYAEQCVDSLSSIGLDLTKPFVALHLREQPSDPHDHRLASVETYFESIRYLLREGYQVVRVGSPWMRDFPAIDGVLDLVSLKRGDQSSHLWVLNNADFLITTTSGPAFLAAALGTRFLMTNATAIGRNTITGPRGTRYLPKHIINSRNQELSLSAILSSPVGYWEGEKTEATASLRIVPNSPTEILEATLEMISHSSGSSENSEFDLIVDDIRAHEKAVSQGRFSSTFLSDNPRWLE